MTINNTLSLGGSTLIEVDKAGSANDAVAAASVNYGGTLTVADLSNRKTHEARHNDRPVAEILAEFRKARLQLVSRVEQLDSAPFGSTRLHPRLKQPMRLVDHLYFVAEHDDHHLARIWEPIRED